MHKCNTPGNPPQAGRFPVVSYRLMITIGARRDANRHGVNPAPAIAAAKLTYANTSGNRFEARRAVFAAVDAQSKGLMA